MLGAFVDEEFLVHGAAEAILWKHALNGYFYYLVRTTGYEALGSFSLLTARITCISHVLLVFHLVAGKNDLTAVDNDYIIAAIEMWRVVWLVLAAEYVCNPGSHAAECLVGGIYHVPITLNDLLVGRLCFKAEVSHCS